MRNCFWAVVFPALLCGRATAQIIQDTSVTITQLSKPDLRAYDELQLPAPGKIKPTKPVVIAIVDDGFDLNHVDYKNFFYHNTREIPGNHIDDDHNGYVDDVMGYDVSDGDFDVSIPKGRETYFYHGTMLMGIVTRLAERCLGPKASDYVKIMPVKAMHDNTMKPVMETGYEGVEYAVMSGADIILLAWNGAPMDETRFMPVFDEARKKGITIIAAAGNFFSKDPGAPASVSTVYVIASIDTALMKMPDSNYGDKIDLVAAGQNVYTAYPLKDNYHFYGEGTSSASALVAGCAAIIKLAQPTATPYQIFDALKNTARPVDSLNRFYGGKLGAGLPQLSNALDYLVNAKNRASYFDKARPVGDIILDKNRNTNSWQLQPAGGFSGFTCSLEGKVKNGSKDRLDIFANDSLLGSYALAIFPPKVEVPGQRIKIVYSGKPSKEPLLLHYKANAIDSPTLYCSGTQSFNTPTGEFGDGSGDADYANNCSCMWQITVPEGKHIRLEFDKFDTQAKKDEIYIFQGTKTLKENLIARFSGPDLPPVVTTGYNQAVIWFLSDGSVTGKGWHLKYTATDDAPGAVAPKK